MVDDMQSPLGWIEIKKVTTKNSKNKVEKCCQYAATVALDYGGIKRVSNIKPFTNKFDWNGIKQSSKLDYWKNFEKNNSTIGFLLFYCIKEMEICAAYVLIN